MIEDLSLILNKGTDIPNINMLMRETEMRPGPTNGTSFFVPDQDWFICFVACISKSIVCLICGGDLEYVEWFLLIHKYVLEMFGIFLPSRPYGKGCFLYFFSHSFKCTRGAFMP